MSNAPEFMTVLPWAVMALVGLFGLVYAFYYPKHTGGIALILILIVSVYLGAPKIYNMQKYGDQADEVQKKQQERAAEEALREANGIPRPDSPGKHQAPKQVWVQHTFTWKVYNKDGTIPKGEWSEPFTVGTGQGCKWNYESGTESFTQYQVRGENDREWATYPVGVVQIPKPAYLIKVRVVGRDDITRIPVYVTPGCWRG